MKFKIVEREGCVSCARLDSYLQASKRFVGDVITDVSTTYRLEGIEESLEKYPPDYLIVCAQLPNALEIVKKADELGIPGAVLNDWPNEYPKDKLLPAVTMLGWHISDGCECCVLAALSDGRNVLKLLDEASKTTSE